MFNLNFGQKAKAAVRKFLGKKDEPVMHIPNRRNHGHVFHDIRTGWESMSRKEANAVYKSLSQRRSGASRRFMAKWLRMQHMTNVLSGKVGSVHPRHLRVKPA